jgi:hypothetical protein
MLAASTLSSTISIPPLRGLLPYRGLRFARLKVAPVAAKLSCTVA